MAFTERFGVLFTGAHGDGNGVFFVGGLKLCMCNHVHNPLSPSSIWHSNHLKEGVCARKTFGGMGCIGGVNWLD